MTYSFPVSILTLLYVDVLCAYVTSARFCQHPPPPSVFVPQVPLMMQDQQQRFPKPDGGWMGQWMGALWFISRIVQVWNESK